MSKIHNTAIIEDGAQLGKNVEIGPYTFVSAKAKIGDGTKVMQGAIIDGDTTIGDNCQIFYHAVVGSIPQDLKFHGEDVRLEIGNNTTIREFCQINPGTKGGGAVTKVGDNCLIMAFVHLAHDVIIGNNVILVNNAAVAGHVEIGDNAIIGGMSAIHQFCKIGEYAMIGGGSVLSQDIPPYCVCEGNRAHIRGLNLTGLKRNFDNKADINAIKNAYKDIFRSLQPMQESAQEVMKNSDNQYAKILAQFVLNTKRGIPFKRKIDE